ncbi:hypothetical protein [Lederbergia citri]|uniref:Uncharacterized protein n=1 Tax=Lederbergia citri TaxID=2833580 RepID=A0A942TEJ0_9BACI|nr:hypothetical protein [Lederbergia citri]MBS4196526.1 hypothetical protein [Lederbergia citri]
MKRNFIVLLASTFIMLINTPSIQASEKNNQHFNREYQEKVKNQPSDPGESVDSQLQERIIEHQQIEEKPVEAKAEKQLVEKQAPGGSRSKSSSLLDLQLAGSPKPLTGDVKLSLLGYSKEKDEGASRLLDIEIDDSPLLGTIKVSVLENEKKTTDTGDQTKRNLVAVELDNQLLGKANIDVLESQGENTDTYHSLKSVLATVNVDNPLIGNVKAAVATHDAYETEDLSYRKGGLVSIEVKETLVGNVNVDVLKSDGKKTDIIDVVTKDTPILDNTDIHVGIDKPSSTDKDPKIPEQSTKKPQEPIVTERLEEAPENVVVPKIQVETPRHQVDTEQPVESEDSDEFPSLEFINIKEAEQDGRPPVQDEVMEEQILSDKPVHDSLADAIQKLLEAGNKQVLNNPAMTSAHTTAINQAEDESKPIDNLYVSIGVMPGPSLSGSGASSSSGNFWNNTGMEDLFAGKLDAISYMANEMTNKALFKVKTLRTKWNKEPPINPPKQSFFLS